MPSWKEESGLYWQKVRKYSRIAVTAQTGKVEHAITSKCPWWKASVLEALRERDIHCGKARLGWNDTQSVDRSTWGRNLAIPWKVTSLQRRNAKKVRVQAAQTIVKSWSPNQECKISLNGVVTVDEECLTDLGSLKYPGGSFSKVIFLKGDLHVHRKCVNYEQVRNIT